MSSFWFAFNLYCVGGKLSLAVSVFSEGALNSQAVMVVSDHNSLTRLSQQDSLNADREAGVLEAERRKCWQRSCASTSICYQSLTLGLVSDFEAPFLLCTKSCILVIFRKNRLHHK